MTCKHCNSNNIVISEIQKDSKMKTRKTGCLWTIGRTLLILSTGGLWLLIGKRSATTNVKHKTIKKAVCQSCGKDWKI